MQSALASNIRPLRRPANLAGGRRVRSQIPARIKMGPARASCVLTDVSREGACLSYTGTLDQDTKLWLIVDNLPPIEAVAAWRKGIRVGVKFEREQDWLQRVNQERFAQLTARSGHAARGRAEPEAQNDWKDF